MPRTGSFEQVVRNQSSGKLRVCFTGVVVALGRDASLCGPDEEAELSLGHLLTVDVCTFTALEKTIKDTVFCGFTTSGP